MTRFHIATAPVSFGLFGDAVGYSDSVARGVVDAMAAAGFSGAELGPPGLFGSPELCACLFAERHLEVVGAYAGLHLAGNDDEFARDLVEFERTCDELCATGGRALVIVADEGDAATRANPARSADHPVRWSGEQWDLASGRLQMVHQRIHDRELVPSFHPHIGTYVENEREIELLLDRTELDLTIDTGHFLLAGVEPAAAVATYSSRINHVHVKDVKVTRVPSSAVTRASDLDEWWADLMSPLGQGDVDLSSFVAALDQIDCRWLVIEQDRDPRSAGSLDGIGRAELANRRWLEELIAEVLGADQSDQSEFTYKGEGL